MDGAWWACFNVPWVCGVVQLYSIFYYLMEKEVYLCSEKSMKQNCVCVCGGGDAEKEFDSRITPWNFSSALDLHKLDGLILLIKLPFCIRKGQWTENVF